MHNITIQQFIQSHTGEVKEAVIIDNKNGNYTWILKEHWDKLEAERLEQSL